MQSTALLCIQVMSNVGAHLHSKVIWLRAREKLFSLLQVFLWFSTFLWFSNSLAGFLIVVRFFYVVGDTQQHSVNPKNTPYKWEQTVKRSHRRLSCPRCSSRSASWHSSTGQILKTQWLYKDGNTITPINSATECFNTPLESPVLMRFNFTEKHSLLQPVLVWVTWGSPQYWNGLQPLKRVAANVVQAICLQILFLNVGYFQERAINTILSLPCSEQGSLKNSRRKTLWHFTNRK